MKFRPDKLIGEFLLPPNPYDIRGEKFYAFAAKNPGKLHIIAADGNGLCGVTLSNWGVRGVATPDGLCGNCGRKEKHEMNKLDKIKRIRAMSKPKKKPTSGAKSGRKKGRRG